MIAITRCTSAAILVAAVRLQEVQHLSGELVDRLVPVSTAPMVTLRQILVHSGLVSRREP